MKQTSTPAFLILVAGGALALWAPHSARASAMLKPTTGVSMALTPTKLDLNTDIHGAFAQTTLTTTYSNPNAQQIEADFIYSAPEGSVVTGFSYWYRGEKVVARVSEKARAARIYQYITSRMRDPALVEMVGKNTFRARIFPVEANTDLKIEIKLAQTLSATKNGFIWHHPLQEETAIAPLREFSFHARVDESGAGSGGTVQSSLGTLQNGKIDVVKTNFKASDDLRVALPAPATPLRARLFSARDGGATGFFALALTSAANIAKADLKISGVTTYDVIYPRGKSLPAGRAVYVYGRYRGTGVARVTLGGQSVPVTFRSEKEVGNVAASLWGSSQIERLSENAKNRVRVMELSKRFGVPSKWTSWLAIPSQERATFKKQMIASDRNAAAKAYAQAMARGDHRAAQVQKRLVATYTSQLEAIGRDYSSDQELQSLNTYLNDELRSARRALTEASYGGAKPAQVRQWKQWVVNLRRAGARDGANGAEMPVYVVEDEFRVASRLLTIEVENGRGDGRKAQALQRRMKELENTKVGRNYGWNQDSFASEQAQMRANALAMEIASDQLSDRPSGGQQQDARTRLERISKKFGLDAEQQIQTALYSLASARVTPLANEIAIQEESHQPTPNRLRLERFAKAMKVSPDDLLKTARTTVVRENYNAVTDELVNEVLTGHENSAKAKILKMQVENLKPKSTDSWQTDALKRAYAGRAHQLAYELELENAKANPNETVTAQLEAQLNEVAPLTDKASQSYREWEKSRVASGQGPVDVEQYRYRVAGLDPSDFHGGYGAGDPLIAIEAPADAQSVIAIMPGGAVKVLEWRAANRRWEANFDIPTYATGGDYLITVIVVQKDGTRRTLKLRYRVDTQAPSGEAKLLAADGNEGQALNLDLSASDDTARVTALLPWGERQVLRRHGTTSLFSSRLDIPAEWRGKKFVVRFVLVDKAHNRTELTVDWN